MDPKMKVLSIAVITMNRAQQLEEALESCLHCKLPEETEIVVLDNASTDQTSSVIDRIKKKYPQYLFRYYYSETNLGVGGGRSYVFEKADGKYIYFLDDDAIISPENCETFFVESIKFLEEHDEVASLTTRIQDEVFGEKRNEIASRFTLDGKKMMFFYLGGSHFLKKASFSSPLYFNIKYGGEEYAPSIKAMDKGYYHVFDESISIIHKPKVNKWIDGTERMRSVQISCAAVVYATKRILYPTIFFPVIWAFYQIRCKKYLSRYKGAKEEANSLVKEIIENNSCKKVKVKTVCKMYQRFGLTVF